MVLRYRISTRYGTFVWSLLIWKMRRPYFSYMSPKIFAKGWLLLCVKLSPNLIQIIKKTQANYSSNNKFLRSLQNCYFQLDLIWKMGRHNSSYMNPILSAKRWLLLCVEFSTFLNQIKIKITIHLFRRSFTKHTKNPS